MDPMMTPARSWLFVPSTRPDRYAKAVASGADRVIFDLEDAVAPNEKADARRHLGSTRIPQRVPGYVRVNSALTLWFEDDLATAAGLPIRGILLPKADSAAHVEQAAARLPDTCSIVPIIETAAGFWNVLEVARARRVERLVFGALDFSLETGMNDEDGAFNYVRSQIVLASKVAGIAPPVDSVSLSIDDPAILHREATRSRHFGFAGKLCIHPRQLQTTNEAFRPTTEEVEWAAEVLREVAARPSDAVFAFRGALVDRPVIERARQIHTLAESAPRR